MKDDRAQRQSGAAGYCDLQKSLGPSGSGMWLAALGVAGLVLLGVATLVDVGSRWLLDTPVFGMSDLFELAVPPVIASFFPAVIASKQNITIRYLGARLSARSGQAVELFGQIATFAVLCGVVWELGGYVIQLYQNGQTTWLLLVPVWPSWALSEAFFLICLPAQFCVIVETLRSLVLGVRVGTDGTPH